ncbi:alpha/beta hydrolase [Actinomadura sp. ATCC 31491]|uniref:Alpha/beta hydrolase n=1 Tax=Actinomadura luzonensis TaxID=2805427 RepID=A0ABT0FUR0_9ACTN|nr:alpha/beta hydrolase [Actinomadura luzonensis]MCK2215898.1 alpha/beta hydrolase [Actinomadura luzonensis]
MSATRENGRPPAPGRPGTSRWADLAGPLHYLDFGGPEAGPVVVAVHGLGGSALNWIAVAPLLTGTCRLIAPDLAGHGLTQALGRPTTVPANRELLHRFIERVPGEPVILMGNSMGGMISLIEAGLCPRAVSGLVLLDPAAAFVPALPDPLVAAVFMVYTAPWFGTAMMARRRALPAETVVPLILRLICADPAKVPPEVVHEHIELTRRRGELGLTHVERDFVHAARSVVRTAGGMPGSAYRRAIRAVRAPALVVHGERDRLVPAAASRALVRSHPWWDLVVLPGVGHVPQMEAPRETAAEVLRWLAAPKAAAAVAAATHALSGGTPGPTATSP